MRPFFGPLDGPFSRSVQGDSAPGSPPFAPARTVFCAALGRESRPTVPRCNLTAEVSEGAVIVSNKLSDWLRLSGLRPEGLQPNHAWRHRLKTSCRELAISDRVVDAMQGHEGRTAGDNYGDVTLKTKIDAINRMPDYDI